MAGFRDDQGEYTIFVQRMMHFTNISNVYRDLLERHYIPRLGASVEDYPSTYDTVLFLMYGMFYSVIDDHPKGVDAFRIWRKFFPEEEERIAAAQALVDPYKKHLKLFRNRLVFHGSQSFDHERAGFAALDQQNLPPDQILRAMYAVRVLHLYFLDKAH